MGIENIRGSGIENVGVRAGDDSTVWINNHEASAPPALEHNGRLTSDSTSLYIDVRECPQAASRRMRSPADHRSPPVEAVGFAGESAY